MHETAFEPVAVARDKPCVLGTVVCIAQVILYMTHIHTGSFILDVGFGGTWRVGAVRGQMQLSSRPELLLLAAYTQVSRTCDDAWHIKAELPTHTKPPDGLSCSPCTRMHTGTRHRVWAPCAFTVPRRHRSPERSR